jgi:F-type H+-transporting ATPase subunit epsilon
MTVNILVMAPDGLIWDQVVDEVVLPGKTGQLGVLEGHTPLITALQIGILRIKIGEKWSCTIALGGFATILNNQVTVLVSEAEVLIPGKLEDATRLLTEANDTLDTLSRSSADKKVIGRASQIAKCAKARVEAYRYMS